MNNLARGFLSWIPLAIAVTGLCMLIYMVGQQNYRQGLNDPQIQLAEDVSAELGQGASPVSVMQQERVDIANSLKPWIAIYDQNGKPVASSGVLDDAFPVPPSGVFESAKKFSAGCVGFGPFEPEDYKGCNSAQNRVTWQPNSNVRQALVVVYVPQKEEYVVAGRTMREVEKREAQLSFFIAIAWICIMGATLIAKVVIEYFSKMR